MSARMPVVRQTSWPATIPQVAAIVIATSIGWFLTRSSEGVIWGTLVYLVYSFGSRSVLLRAHRRGMHHLRLQQYTEAIRAFESSYSFFSRSPWIDRYRSITMMSPSAISYREMALVNIAFSYSQLGQGISAKESYQRALDEFPNSAWAKAALRLIESVERPDCT